MHRFSTPEEVFGPFMLSKLREDRLVRNIEYFLPNANFAFLDEIWKSSSAILNTLLTLINERRFQNGEASIKVPLIGLIAASNEFPEVDSGLEALYDRFLLRVVVDRVSAKSDFQKLLLSSSAQENPDIAPAQCFSLDELADIKQKAQSVEIPPHILEILLALNANIKAHNDAESKALDSSHEAEANIIDISDRRWIACMELLRVSAVCNGRSALDETDILLLNYCLWGTLEHREILRAMIAKVILDSIADAALLAASDDLAPSDARIQNLVKTKNLSNITISWSIKRIKGKDYIHIDAQNDKNREQYLVEIGELLRIEPEGRIYSIDKKGEVFLSKKIHYKYDKSFDVCHILEADGSGVFRLESIEGIEELLENHRQTKAARVESIKQAIARKIPISATNSASSSNSTTNPASSSTSNSSSGDSANVFIHKSEIRRLIGKSAQKMIDRLAGA